MNRRLVNILAAAIVLGANNGADAKPPHLAAHGAATQLIVNDQPFLIIGGQVHNSSSGNAAYFDRTVRKLVQLHVNTVFAPVTWELLEPVEGKYDFGQLDDMVRIARKHRVKLGLLWFGSWKNGVSQYAPAWVRQDTGDFRVRKIRTGARCRRSPRSASVPRCGQGRLHGDDEASAKARRAAEHGDHGPGRERDRPVRIA